MCAKMTALEITKLKSLSDLEVVKLCAEAMGLRVQLLSPATGFPSCNEYCIPSMTEGPNPKYDPLHDDAQAMVLVKKLRLWPIPHADGTWHLFFDEASNDPVVSNDLNRAICECVAKMQKEKQNG